MPEDRQWRAPSPRPSLELWGGLECSVVRIGDNYRDQVRETGHHGRPDDLERIAALGIRTLRYPIVWETVAPDNPDVLDWRWHDDRLERLRRLGITPIVGLVHHGSGPRHASIVEPHFPEALARFAGAVARRYPWVTRFTPVNEPLTTARFCCLYGLWHPHQRNRATFLRAVLHQCRGVIEAMRAIRAVTPEAQLVQTEDLGRVFGTRRLAAQAEYENNRRWLSLDILCGRFGPDHIFRREFRAAGITDAEIAWLDGDWPAPDIVGINHYLTSDRYLDERLALFPPATHGGNGRIAYADTEAYRVDLPLGELGPGPRLAEAWERYRLPLAVTEADQQIAWLDEVGSAAEALRAAGGDSRAVTAWSLFGAVDWNSLLTEASGHYEPGVFDIRRGGPRPTELAAVVAALAQDGVLRSAFTREDGWWRQRARVLYRAVS
jgi:dTDP-4-dehydrorhamnose reductase